MADDKIGQKLGGIAGMLSMFSAGYANANAEGAIHDFKANQLRLNAKLAELQGRSTTEAAADEAALVGKKAGQVIGTQRAQFASQGVDVDSGSAASVQSSTLEQAQLTEDQIRTNAWKEAWGFEVESSNFKSEADMENLEGKGQAFNTILNSGLQGVNALERGWGN